MSRTFSCGCMVFLLDAGAPFSLQAAMEREDVDSLKTAIARAEDFIVNVASKMPGRCMCVLWSSRNTYQ